MWIFYALLAGVFFAITGLLARKYMKAGVDPWMSSFYFSFLLFLFVTPFFLNNPAVTLSWKFLLVTLISSMSSLIGNVLGFRSVKTIGATTRSTIIKLRLLWLAIVGSIFFNESLTWVTASGMALIILSSLLIIDFSSWKFSKQGIILSLITTVTATIVGVCLKYLTTQTSIFGVLFFIALMSIIIYSLITKNFFYRASGMFVHWRFLLPMALIGFLGNLTMMQALKSDVLSGVYFVMDTGLIIMLLGEHFVLQEKDRLWWKVFAVVLAIVGTILLRGL